MRPHAVGPFSVAVLWSFPALASSATICVDPQGGACETTIQAAVDLAAPADVISIAAGVYYENVRVPSGKDDLQIVGAGQDVTIVDSGPHADLGVTESFASFFIQSARVRVAALTMRNGQRGASFQSPGGLVENVHIEAARNYGVLGEQGATGLRVLNSRLEDSGEGVVSQGAAAVTVRGNVLSRVSTALRLLGPRPIVEANRVEGLGGILITGDDAIARDNVIRNIWGVALHVAGRNPKVERNTLTEVDTGLMVSCPQDGAPTSPPLPDACVTGTVSSNAVTDALHDGVIVLTHASGLLVERNRTLRSNGSFSLNGVGIRAFFNTITDAGLEGSTPCFEAFGADHLLSRNVAARCSGTGFLVQGDRVRLEGNQALGTYESGITVSGNNFPLGPHVDAVLLGNTTNDNVMFGIAVVAGATRTVVSGNTALRNRVDFCSSGPGTVVTGNHFGTTGACLN